MAYKFAKVQTPPIGFKVQPQNMNFSNRKQIWKFYQLNPFKNGKYSIIISYYSTQYFIGLLMQRDFSEARFCWSKQSLEARPAKLSRNISNVLNR